MDYENEWTDSSRRFMARILVFEMGFTFIDMMARAVTEKGLEVHEVRASAQKNSLISNPILKDKNRLQILRSGIGRIGCDIMAILCVQFPFPIPIPLLSLYLAAVYYYLNKNVFESWNEVKAEKIADMEHLVREHPIEWRLRWLSYGFSLLLDYVIQFAVLSYYSMVWTQFLVWTGIPLLPFLLSVFASLYLSYYLGKRDWASQDLMQNDLRMLELERQEQQGWE